MFGLELSDDIFVFRMFVSFGCRDPGDTTEGDGKTSVDLLSYVRVLFVFDTIDVTLFSKTIAAEFDDRVL
jgi:hypothetical protein